MTSVQTQDKGMLPIPGKWEIDPSHSSVQFGAKHLGLSKIRGHFSSYSAEIHVGESLEESRVQAVIDASSIDTQLDMRDEHLRSPQFLDAANFSEIRFVSTAIEPAGERWLVRGDLTIRDVTKQVALEVAYHGDADDPMTQVKRAGLSARLEIEREDFGIRLAGPMATLVGKTVEIEIEAEAVFQGN
jgi:polyisoprenoid-binding protein YceI